MNKIGSVTKEEEPKNVLGRRDVDREALIILRREPHYTTLAHRNGINGVVVLRAVPSSSGHVTSVEVIRGLPDGLTEAAIETAREMKFVPAMKTGRLVSQCTEIEYAFRLF